MAVDIDIGGTGLGRMDDDEVTPVDDYEEVEAVEVMDEEPLPPQKAPPSAVKKPNPWVKRIMVLAVVIILIVAGLFAFIFFNTRITDIKVSFSDDDTNFPNSLKVTALAGTTGSASIAGEGNLEVSYENNVVYDTKITFNDGGTATLDLDYNKFIEGNGEYKFTVKYRDVESPPTPFDVDFIVERINISVVVGTVGNSGQMNVTFHMLGEDGDSLSGLPKGHVLTVDLIKNIDNDDEIAKKENPEPSGISPSYFEMDFPYKKSGNYSFSATVINTRAKPTSDYHEITEVREKAFLNILPIAKASHTHIGTLPLTYTVRFDASASWNDGTKSLYRWDFTEDGEIDEETTEPVIEYTFTRGVNPDVNLNVVGDVWVYNIATFEYDIEVGSAIIHVNSP